MLPFHSLVSHFSEARLCDVDAGAACSNEQRGVGDGAGTDEWLATFPSFHLSAVFHLFLEVASRGSPMRIGRNRDETLAFVVEITFVSACLVREDVLMGDFWPQVIVGVIQIEFAGVPNRRPFWKQPMLMAGLIICVMHIHVASNPWHTEIPPALILDAVPAVVRSSCHCPPQPEAGIIICLLQDHPIL